MKFSKNVTLAGTLLVAVFLAACSDSDNDTTSAPVEPSLNVGAASRSILPTVSDGRDYLMDAPNWPSMAEMGEEYPQNPGVYVAAWDQGQVDVGNGEDDSAWVHDDIRVTAIALEREESRVILVASDAYMHFAPDIDKIVATAKAELPAAWADAEILVHGSHNHQGPSTAFSINVDWYEMAENQFAQAMKEAVEKLEPATTKVATTQHGYGTWKDQGPYISDERLNVMTFSAFDDGELLATMVQWAAHPETTLNMVPEAEFVDCPPEEDNCDAKGRYFTADFPGVLQTRLMSSHGGEVLYLNGAIMAVTTLNTPLWQVTEEHPVGSGKSVPQGAEFVPGCDDYSCKNFAVIENIGNELYNAVVGLMDSADDFEMSELSVTTTEYFTRLSNLGFSVTYAEDGLGWFPRNLYTCEIPYSVENCTDTEGAKMDDPLGVEVMVGNVLTTRISRVDFGSVGMLFMPGELPPELVVGLPEDFNSSEESIIKYYGDVDRHTHATGDDYVIPGYLLSLPDEAITFTVGLGNDQVGYLVQLSDYQVACSELVLGAIGSPDCATLESLDVIDKTELEGESTYWVSGRTCKGVDEKDPETLEALGEYTGTVSFLCRYGQALGQAKGHYHETRSPGWNAANDIFDAAKTLY